MYFCIKYFEVLQKYTFFTGADMSCQTSFLITKCVCSTPAKGTQLRHQRNQSVGRSVPPLSRVHTLPLCCIQATGTTTVRRRTLVLLLLPCRGWRLAVVQEHDAQVLLLPWV